MKVCAITLLLLGLLCLPGVAWSQTVTPIRLLQLSPATYESTSVVVEGVVTIGTGLLNATQLKAYVEDTSGFGILVFATAMTDADRAAYVRGNVVRVAGTVSQYAGSHGAILELTSSSAMVMGTRSLPTPPVLTARDMGDTLDYEGAYFEVEGNITNITTTTSSKLATLVDAGADTMTVKIPTAAGLPADTIRAGRHYRLRGVGETYNAMIEMDVCYTSDVFGSHDTDTTHPGAVTPISAIQRNPAGFTNVTIDGIVTIGAGLLDTARLKVYVQDSTGYGVQIYSTSMTAADRAAYVRGNHVQVSGTVNNYLGTHGAVTEITGSTPTLIGTGTLPTPPAITVLASLDSIRYEGAYFLIEGNVTGTYDAGWAQLVDLTDAGGQTITVVVPVSAHIPISTLASGGHYRVRGVGTTYDATEELQLAYAADVSGGDTTHPGTVTPISRIQQNPAAFSNVTIEGIVTIGANILDSLHLKAYVQDSSNYGIQIYAPSMTSGDIANLTRSNIVRVTGTVTQYRSVTEIANPVVTLLGVDDWPAPPTIAFPSPDTIRWEGAYFRARGTVTSDTNMGYQRLVNFRDDGGNYFTAKVMSTTHIPLSALVTGQHYTISGVGEAYRGEIEVDIGYPDDIMDVRTSNRSLEATAVYPNPFTGECRIAAPRDTRVQVTDLLGRPVQDLGLGVTTWAPNPDITPGAYLIKAGDQVIKVVYLK